MHQASPESDLHQLQLASDGLMSLYAPDDAPAWKAALAELAGAGRVGPLGRLDARALQHAAGFDAIDAALDRELPFDAVQFLSGEHDTSGEVFAPPRVAQSFGLSWSDSSPLQPAILDPDDCFKHVNSGHTLLLPQAWRVLGGLRPLHSRVAAVCQANVGISLLLVPPDAQLRSTLSRVASGQLLLALVEGQAAISIITPSERAKQPAAQLRQRLQRGMLRRTALGMMEQGSWACAPGTRALSLEIDAGPRGAVIVLVSLTAPNWAQLAAFTVEQGGQPALLHSASESAIPPDVLPKGAELQQLMAAYRRHLHDRRTDMRRGRLNDVMQVARMHRQTPLRVRADRALDVSHEAAADGHIESLARAYLRLPSGALVCYACLGMRWRVEAALQPWVDGVLGRNGVFRPRELLPPPRTTGRRGALALCRAMVEHGLLQIADPAA